MTKTLIVILGPTGVGKTGLSLKIAQNYHTEIISSDSRQIYKELQIGTATPNSQQLNIVKHHFVNSISISDYYSAAKFEKEATTLLAQLFKKYKVALMVGGSMLYIDAVCKGIDDIPTISSEVRKNLLDRFQNEGIESLRFELKKIDPSYYEEVDLKNHKRILHALEVYYETGKVFSSLRKNTIKQRNFKIIKIGLNTDRTILHNKINCRVDRMIEEGLIEEARQVYSFKHLNALNTVGYRELFDYFDNNCSLNEAIEKIKTNSRRYARKQLTWFRKDSEIKWFEPSEENQVLSFIKEQLKLNNN